MMRSMTLLSSTVAVAMATDSNASNTQQLWYPDFASHYESGRCTTAPSTALLAFAAGSINPNESSLALNDMESCCETWFPDQELCGCLGGCPDENDAASAFDTAPTAAAPLADEYKYWYPIFGVTYEGGQCVKAGVNTDIAPPSYYTEEGRFLLATLDACCDQWFGQQQAMKCMHAINKPPTAQPTASMAGVNATRTAVDTMDASTYHEASGSAFFTDNSL